MNPKKRKQSQRRHVDTGIDRAAALRIAGRYFERIENLHDYAARVNASLPVGSPPMTLLHERDVDQNSAYVRLLSRVLLAWPDASYSLRDPPASVEEGLIARPGTISHDDILSRVIVDILRKFPDSFDARNGNVLANGFVLGRPDGPGSVFRNLDLRGSSGSVNVLTSPPWKLLFERIGHVAAKHLLVDAVILITVESSSSTAFWKKPSVTLLQLSGPLAVRRQIGSKRQFLATKVQLKRDLLYRTSCRQYVRSARIEVPGSSVARNVLRDAECEPHRSCVVPKSRQLLNTGLPASHILQCLRAECEDDAVRLLGFIFQDCRGIVRKAACHEGFRIPKRRRIFHGKPLQTMRLPAHAVHVPPRMKPLLSLLQLMLQRIAKRSFRAVLGETCAIAKRGDSWQFQAQVSISELVKLQTEPARVSRFLIRACRQALPLAIFGSFHNRAVFEDVIRALVRHRTRNETMDLKSVLSARGLRVTEIQWLHRTGKRGSKVCNPTDLRFRQDRSQDMLNWLIRYLCLPILHQNFYATEHEMTKNRVVYYRREIWTGISDTTFKALLRSERRQFILLTRSALKNVMLKRLGVLQRAGSVFCPLPVVTFGSIRLLPKATGVRGIQRIRVNLLREKYRQSTANFRELGNSQNKWWSAPSIIERSLQALRTFYANAQEILSAEIEERPEVVGSSVFSIDDIYAKFSEFVKEWKSNACPRMFFLCTDIAKSFDTLPQSTLLEEVLPGVLTREQYVLLRYFVVKRHVASEELTYRCCVHVCRKPGEEAHFPRVVREHLAKLHPGALLVDLVNNTAISREHLLSIFVELLSNNVVAVPQRMRSRRKFTAFALQCQGVPQGCPLSPILTSLFYAHVERSDLLQPAGTSGCRKNGSSVCQISMRLVDDFIFGCSNEQTVREMFEKMTRGWDDRHGFSINPSKTKCNFKAGEEVTNIRHIPWCGFIIDSITLEIRNDYDRYVKNGFRVRDTLTIVHGLRAVHCLLRKASSCFNPKIHAILLDRTINTPQTVALNIYQASMFTALKLCSYAQQLFSRRNQPKNPNTACLFKHITRTTVYKFCEIIRIRRKAPVALKQGCVFPLKDGEVKYIVTRAFRDVLGRRLSLWYTHGAIETLTEQLSVLRFYMSHGTMLDLEIKFKCVFKRCLSKSLWRIKL